MKPLTITSIEAHKLFDARTERRKRLQLEAELLAAYSDEDLRVIQNHLKAIKYARWSKTRVDTPERAARKAALLPQCQVPPPGWRCTRGAGHDGPCAAVPTK